MTSATAMPTRLSRFIGRKKELAELRRLLPHTRLLTLLGPGGAGKTRLAQEFVARIEPDRALFAELSDLHDPALVLEAVGRAAGVRLEGTDPIPALVRHLQDRRILVVDNCEHLVDAAADAISTLLAGCPQLTVLATSRERLNVEGEVTWTVPPLGVTAGTDVASADGSDAARLFVDRARSVQPAFTLDDSNAAPVLEICRRLDGIPLAIELAAARMTTLAPQDIVARLEAGLALLTGGSRGAASRQQTVRATIDWSYELLDLTEQRLLQRMSVFAGAPDAGAVEEVCAFPPLDAAAVLDGLTGLVEKSMVQVVPGDKMRFRLLVTIREYAAEKLAATEDGETARDRHLVRYRRLADEARVVQYRRGTSTEHHLLWNEMEDVRAALDRARGAPGVELELLGNLFGVWMTFAQLEGRERITAALNRAPKVTTLVRAQAGVAYAAIAGMTKWTGPWAITPSELAQMAEELGDDHIQAHQEMGFGYFAERHMDDLEGARAHFKAAIDRFGAVGATSWQSMAMGSLGAVEMQLGNATEARAWMERAVELSHEVGDRFNSIGARFHLGHYELEHGTRSAAVAEFMAGLAFVEPSDGLSVAYQAEGLACAVSDDDPRFAYRLFAAAERLHELAGSPRIGFWATRVEATQAQTRAGLEKAAADAAWRAGSAMTPEAVIEELNLRFGPNRHKDGKASRGLSRRELEIAGLVATGMTSRAIAEKLFLSERTVETHLTNVMTKLGFNSRAQVAAWVAEQRD